MQTDLSTGQKPNIRCPWTPGRPWKTWCSQIWTDVGMSPHNYWDACIHRGHSGVMQRSTRASQWWWWWRSTCSKSCCFTVISKRCQIKIKAYIKNLKNHHLPSVSTALLTYHMIYFIMIYTVSQKTSTFYFSNNSGGQMYKLSMSNFLRI